MIGDFTQAYDNRAAVPEAGALLAGFAERSAAFRATAAGRLDLPYGPHPRERLDLFAPQGAARGVVVFFHGGYWRALGREAFGICAQGALARGWAVAVPSYPLCPEVRIAAITLSAARAAEAAAGLVAGEVVLAGHSAGGHLAARLACEGGPLAGPVAARVSRVVGISGVYDLRPLMRSALNDDLRLDLAEARAESPALAEPRPGTRLTAWVGGAELPEFVRQNAAFASLWHGLGIAAEAVEAPGLNHFTVLDDLADGGSALVARLAGDGGAA